MKAWKAGRSRSSLDSAVERATKMTTVPTNRESGVPPPHILLDLASSRSRTIRPARGLRVFASYIDEREALPLAPTPALSGNLQRPQMLGVEAVVEEQDYFRANLGVDIGRQAPRMGRGAAQKV